MHVKSDNLLMLELKTQAQFRKNKPPKTHRYDSSLSFHGLGRPEPGA
ncbi:MAG: hypothetical protein V1792_22200 [Pseudomonadota bacterium]